MSPAFVHSGNRASRIPAVLLLVATGCASALRSSEYAVYDCLVVENETADAVSVYIDAGSYALELGRIGPASRRALRLRRADLPESFTHAYLRIVPGPAATAWPPQPGPLSELIRTADTNRTLWRYTGRELIPNRAAGTSESPDETSAESRCASTPPGR